MTRFSPSARCAPMTAAERQARIDYLALVLQSATTSTARRMAWEEMRALILSRPLAERNAIARRRGLPEELV
jgi:hypothetical protein